jgi:membrane-bound metal-dependent hydrolase YbcI (DUF457 family)
VTTFEHAMCGATLALAVGCLRKHGWALIVVAGVAAALPDWDGLSLALGAETFDRAHRVWGHNLLVATTTGAVVGGLGYLCYLSTRVRRATIKVLPRAGVSEASPPFSAIGLATWIVVGVVASLSHLPADMIYTGSRELRSWPVPLLWPFSEQRWDWPLVPWGDLITTVIFIAEMFALYRWSRKAQLIAVLTLLAVHGYIGFRWLTGGVGQ